MNFSEPDRKCSVHEGNDALHLLQAQPFQMAESEPADIVDDSQSGYLGLHFSGHHL